MENITISPSDRTPQIDFNFQTGRLSIKGEAYPENASAFFGPLLIAIRTYLQTLPEGEVFMDIKMEYFNSSSAKALMNLFQIMDGAAKDGVNVMVHWHYHADDETMQEFGEDFSEDLEFLHFEMVRIS